MSEPLEGQVNMPLQDDLQRALESLKKFQIGSDSNDIDSAIDSARASVKALSEKNEGHADSLSVLGACLQQRYQTSGTKNVEDLNEAAEAGRVALELSIKAEHTQDLKVYFHNLQASILFRFQETQDTGHLEDGIRMIKELLEIVPPNSPIHAFTLDMLCTVYGHGFNATQRPNYLHEASAAAEQALSISPKKHPFRVNMLQTLLETRRIEFARDKSTANMDGIISACRELRETFPPDHADQLEYTHLLAAFSTMRFRRTNEVDDLHSIIEYCQAAWKLAPMDPSSDDLSPAEERSFGALHTLRAHIQILFERTGDLPELDESVLDVLQIEYMISKDDENAVAEFRKLADIFHRTYEKTGRVVDIEYAIIITLRALLLLSDTNEEWEAVQDIYRARYRLWSELTGKMPDGEIVIMGFGHGGSWIPPEFSDGLGLSVPHIIFTGELGEEVDEAKEKIEGEV